MLPGKQELSYEHCGYPDNEDEIIEGITLAVNAYAEIKNIYAAIKARL